LSILVKRKEGQELITYETRFKILRDMTLSQIGGEIIPHKIIDSGIDPISINRKPKILKERNGTLLSAWKHTSFKQDQTHMIGISTSIIPTNKKIIIPRLNFPANIQ